MRTTCLEFMIIPPYGATVNSVRRQCKAVGYKDRDHCGISDGLATLCCFLQQPLAPMLGNTSPMKYRQSFVDGKPYQPTAEGALAIKCRYVVTGREQAISTAMAALSGLPSTRSATEWSKRRYRVARTYEDLRLSAETLEAGIASCECSFEFNVDLTFTSTC